MNTIRPNILLVDDDADSMAVLQEILLRIENIEFELQYACSGPEALRLLESQNIDVVLADIRMPKMSGLEFMKRAAQNGKYQPFIFITALHARRYAIEAIRLGAFDFIEKPISIEKLEVPLRKAIKVAKAYKRLEQEVLIKPQIEQASDLRYAALAILKLRAMKYQNMPE